MPGSRDGVEATAASGMTAKQAAEGEHTTTQPAMMGYGECGVFRARRLKAAAAEGERVQGGRDGALVDGEEAFGGSTGVAHGRASRERRPFI